MIDIDFLLVLEGKKTENWIPDQVGNDRDNTKVFFFCPLCFCVACF